MNTNTPVTAHLVPDADRANIVHGLFGMHFPLLLEPTVFNMTGTLAKDYSGGLWAFYTVSNGAFYMVPEGISEFEVASENGFAGRLSAEALGITACLYAYSHLSFGVSTFAQVSADQYHLLREFVLDHAEARSILAAID